MSNTTTLEQNFRWTPAAEMSGKDAYLATVVSNRGGQSIASQLFEIRIKKDLRRVRISSTCLKASSYFYQIADETENVLSLIYKADARNDVETTLDLIFEWFDDQFLVRNFPNCDAFLCQADSTQLSIQALVGILSITLNAKSLLNARATFFAKVRSKIQNERPTEIQALLCGLE